MKKIHRFQCVSENRKPPLSCPHLKPIDQALDVPLPCFIFLVAHSTGSGSCSCHIFGGLSSPHWGVSFIRAGASSDLFTTEFSDRRIVPTSSQEMLSKYLLNSFNKNFVIKVLHALSLVHCRHSLSIYAILKEVHGQWELGENEHLEPQRVFS